MKWNFFYVFYCRRESWW